MLIWVEILYKLILEFLKLNILKNNMVLNVFNMNNISISKLIFFLVVINEDFLDYVASSEYASLKEFFLKDASYIKSCLLVLASCSIYKFYFILFFLGIGIPFFIFGLFLSVNLFSLFFRTVFRLSSFLSSRLLMFIIFINNYKVDIYFNIISILFWFFLLILYGELVIFMVNDYFCSYILFILFIFFLSYFYFNNFLFSSFFNLYCLFVLKICSIVNFLFSGHFLHIFFKLPSNNFGINVFFNEYFTQFFFFFIILFYIILTFYLFTYILNYSFFFFLSLYFSFLSFIFSFILLGKYLSVVKIDPFFFDQEYVISLNSFIFSFQFDSISLLLITLTTLLIFLSILASVNRVYSKKDFSLESVILLFIQSLLILSFITLDLSVFFLCFESILIPMIVYLLVLGGDARKSLAFKYFFFFSFFGSLLMLFSVISLYNICGTTNINSIILFSESFNLWITLPLCVGLMIKVPMFPFYIWLPEAHVEAPTTGSMILAGILLKLGGYGFLRFFFPLIGENLLFFQNLIFFCSILGVVYASFSILILSDLKKIIAFSSIIHMNIGMLSLFTYTPAGILGFIIVMVAHGLVSAGLFFLVGIIYSRFGTRLIKDFKGLHTIMPLYTFFFFLFIFANISFPGTLNFVGEFLLFIGITFNFFFISIFILFFSAFFGAIYSVWLLTRVSFGVFKPKNLAYISFQDISFLEAGILLILSFFIWVLGVCPGSLFNFVLHDVIKLSFFL